MCHIKIYSYIIFVGPFGKKITLKKVIQMKDNAKQSLYTHVTGTLELQKDEAPRFLEIRYMKVVRL